MFKFMYDDDAPNPCEQFKENAKHAATAVNQNKTWQTAVGFAKVGMYVGAFAGGIILVGGLAQTINRIVLGNK